MSADEHHSDLEVVSKEMANGYDDDNDSQPTSPSDSPGTKQFNDTTDSGLASPTNSPLMKQSGQVQAFSEDGIGMKLDTAMVKGRPNGTIDGVLNGVSSRNANGNMGGMSPEEYSADPMLASALMSPLGNQEDFEAMFSPIRPNINRAPSILHRASSVSSDWELYKRAGPKYPAALEQLIMKHHQKHSNSWQLAHDLGAGSGIYSPTLAKFFRHIHISDPTTSGLATSRQLLNAWSVEHPKKRGRFSFSVGNPEQAAECVADSSVDLAIITESAHWSSDPEAMVRSIAQTLGPGGTLAIITHRPISNVVGDEKVKEAVQRLFDAWGRRPWDIACGGTSSTKSRQQFSLGLDFIPLPEELFQRQHTRRITINTHGAARELFRVPDADEGEDTPMSPDDMWDMASSRVDTREKRHEYGDGEELGRGWRHEVAWESFRSRIAMFEAPEVLRRLEPELAAVQELIMRTSPDGYKVVIEWAVAVVLATRK
ncbi:hypothetical protein LTR08_009067 [Meristemomyces frigidus]|nr:hypothetical protein LTR08_009067 [Meristemomyces frigidus]